MSKIIFGAIFIIGGASGQMALRGTQSSGALVVVGVVLVLWGVLTMKSRSREE